MADEPASAKRPLAFRIYLGVAAVVILLCLGYIITDAAGSPRTADVFFKIVVWAWAVIGCAAIVILFREAARRPAEQPEPAAEPPPPAEEPPAPAGEETKADEPKDGPA